jgi:hypothetical protein
LTKTARKSFIPIASLLNLLYWISLALFLGRINWLAPLGGDGWFHVIVVRNGALHRYINSYLNVNPRIGEFFTALSYASDWHAVLINTGSVILLILLVFGYLFKRLPKIGSLDDFFYLNIILALLWLCLPKVGLMFFFSPWVSNYLLGFALLLLFTLPFYRFSNGLRPGLTARFGWLLMFFGGIVAGMSNEHTVPPVLIALSLLFIFQHQKKMPAAGWQLGGFGGLLLGYLLLYFAPGQGKRYGGEGQQIYDNLADKLLQIPELISRLWSLPSILSLLLVVLLAFSLFMYFFGRQRRSWGQIGQPTGLDSAPVPIQLDPDPVIGRLLMNCVGFMVLAHLMIGILFISPKQGEKLFLGPVLLMLMAFMLLASYWLGKIRGGLLIFGISAILVNGYFAQMIYQDYEFYRQEFDDRIGYINQRKQAGDRIIFIKPYKTQTSRYIWGDDSGRIKQGMPSMGVYFDVDKITYPPAQ